MFMTPIGGQASNYTALHLDPDEMVALKRLLVKTTVTPSVAVDGSTTCSPEAVDLADQLYKFRRRRDLRAETAFGQGLFADPAWDMLLDLFVQNARGHSVSISSACHGSISPSTTALRHLAELERRGIVMRRPNPSDRRVLYVNLSAEGLTMMNNILSDFAQLFCVSHALGTQNAAQQYADCGRAFG